MSYIIIPGGQVQIDKDWRASRYYGIDVARVEIGGTVASATVTISGLAYIRFFMGLPR